jgi:hypothetical protein
MNIKVFLVHTIIKVLTLGRSVTYKAPSNGTIRWSDGVGKVKGFYRLRKRLSRGYGIQKGDTFTQVHLGRITVAWETASIRSAGNFIGNMI